ncbi:MAG: FAD:protein FMN transferase [Planctomycetota bacterium]|nr:MAG: FAD:protein FMN transferase [Planctomycetota bacterium]
MPQRSLPQRSRVRRAASLSFAAWVLGTAPLWTTPAPGGVTDAVGPKPATSGSTDNPEVPRVPPGGRTRDEPVDALADAPPSRPHTPAATGPSAASPADSPRTPSAESPARGPGPSPAVALRRWDFTDTHMGVPIRITFYASAQQHPREAAAAAFQRIARLDAIFSDYRADSEARRLSDAAGSGKWMSVSPEMWDVLTTAVEISAKTEGAFDVTVGPVVRLWRRARRQHRRPSEERLREAQSAVGYRLIELDRRCRRVRLKRPGMRLDFGGIAKGYATDEALRVLQQHGIRSALIDAGGDLRLGEPPPGRTAWTVAVADLTREAAIAERLSLRRCAIATSGDLYQFVEIDGTRYSHIIDPRTGEPVVVRRSVSVLAPSGMLADALASAISVLGPQRGMRVLDRFPGTAALVFQLGEGGRVERFQSRNWPPAIDEPRR